MDVCNLEDFKKAFFCLDELISREIQSGNKEIIDNSPLEVRAIGGFALLYHELRTSMVTADIDNVMIMPDCYRDIIKVVAKELDMPQDWLNNHSSAGIDAPTAKWEKVSWNLKNIEIYVLDIKELLIDKCGWAEKNLSGSVMTDRDDTKDLNDFLGILWRLNLVYNTIEELRERLLSFEIDINDYPYVKEYIENDLNDDGIVWPDGHV